MKSCSFSVRCSTTLDQKSKQFYKLKLTKIYVVEEKVEYIVAARYKAYYDEMNYP